MFAWRSTRGMRGIRNVVVGVAVGLIIGWLLCPHDDGASNHHVSISRIDDAHAPAQGRARAAPVSDDYCAYFNTLPKKYVAFEPWTGGWNNRRLSLEHAAVMAVAGGRTLVLPPTTAHIPEEHIGAVMLNYEDGYDMERMRQFINVATWTEFMECGGKEGLLRAPDKNHNITCKSELMSKRDFYCTAMRQYIARAFIPAFDPATRMSIPMDSIAQDPIPQLRFRNRRQIPGPFDDPTYQKEVFLHYRSTLICYANYIMIDPRVDATDEMVGQLALRPTTRHRTDRTLKQRVFGAMRDGLVYTPEVMRLADAAVAELGGVDGFSCVHLRRGDFNIQRPESYMEVAQLLNAFRDVFAEGERVLIMTEKDAPVKQQLADANGTYPNLNVRFWTELDAVKSSRLRKTLDPLACQQTCVRSREFVGVVMSTYSGYIVKQRGFRDPPRLSYYLETAAERHDPANPEAMKPGYFTKPAMWALEPEVGWTDTL